MYLVPFSYYLLFIWHIKVMGLWPILVSSLGLTRFTEFSQNKATNLRGLTGSTGSRKPSWETQLTPFFPTEAVILLAYRHRPLAYQSFLPILWPSGTKSANEYHLCRVTDCTMYLVSPPLLLLQSSSPSSPFGSVSLVSNSPHLSPTHPSLLIPLYLSIIIDYWRTEG